MFTLIVGRCNHPALRHPRPEQLIDLCIYELFSTSQSKFVYWVKFNFIKTGISSIKFQIEFGHLGFQETMKTFKHRLRFVKFNLILIEKTNQKLNNKLML